MPSLDQFLQLISRSGLLNESALASLRTAFTGESAAAFGEHLIANNAMTRWQVENLLAGRHKGFFLDQYKLVDHLADTKDRIRYLAEDQKTGTKVVIAAVPRILADSREDRKYDVEDFQD